MARNECRCTVPTQEFGPSWGNNADREAWAKMNGVVIVEDYLGRPAVSIEDAYKIGEHRKRAEAEAQRTYELRLAVVNANQERQRIYDDVMRAELKSTRGTRLPRGAQQRAMKAVVEYEKQLPREVRSQLDAINITFTEMTF